VEDGARKFFERFTRGRLGLWQGARDACVGVDRPFCGQLSEESSTNCLVVDDTGGLTMTDNTTPTPSQPEEPTPAYAAPTGTVPPADGVSPVPPTQRSTPKWIWIAGGVAILLILILVLVSVLRGNQPDVSPAAPATPVPTIEPLETPSPVPSSTPRPTSTPTAGGSAAAGDYLSIDTFVDFDTADPALWAVPVLAGWEKTDVAEEGLNQFANAELSCLYTASQSRQPASDTTATSDRPDTEQTLVSIQDSFASQAEQSSITSLDSVDVSWGSVGSDAKMEFLSSRVDYVRADTGENYSTIFLARATPQIGGLLYASVNCPTATFGSATDPTQALLDGSAIIPSY
jgi:hypothetical protein